jgi:hypothetical protein
VVLKQDSFSLSCGSILSILYLSLSLFSRSSDGVKRGDGGGAMAGRGLRLFSPEATEAVEWVLRHFFLPN